jgi:hypothetical protein
LQNARVLGIARKRRKAHINVPCPVLSGIFPMIKDVIMGTIPVRMMSCNSYRISVRRPLVSADHGTHSKAIPMAWVVAVLTTAFSASNIASMMT